MAIPAIAVTVVVAIFLLGEQGSVDDDNLWIAAYSPGIVAAGLAGLALLFDSTRSVPARVGLCVLAGVIALALAFASALWMFVSLCQGDGCLG